MKPTYNFPVILIAMDIGATVMCAVNKEYKKCIYWIAAAVLTVTVTF